SCDDRSNLCASPVADRSLVLDPAAAFGLASGGGERSRGISSASGPGEGLDRACDGSRQWDARLSRRRDGFPSPRRLLPPRAPPTSIPPPPPALPPPPP